MVNTTVQQSYSNTELCLADIRFVNTTQRKSTGQVCTISDYITPINQIIIFNLSLVVYCSQIILIHFSNFPHDIDFSHFYSAVSFWEKLFFFSLCAFSGLVRVWLALSTDDNCSVVELLSTQQSQLGNCDMYSLLVSVREETAEKQTSQK